MLHAKDCKSERWKRTSGGATALLDITDCGLCGRTFYLDTMVSNSFMEEWLCECCSRPASPFKVFVVILRSLARRQ